jgi:hypothetical protein
MTRPTLHLIGLRRSRAVDPSRQEVFKFLPSSPPEKHEIVLVDRVRCRVTRCRVAWDGPRWTIRSLRVKPA